MSGPDNACQHLSTTVRERSLTLKHAAALTPNAPLTLQDVLDRIDRSPGIIDSRKRDLRSAVISYAKLTDAEPCFVALDLAAIRQVLDSAGDVAKMSPKRRANLRSDLASAIAAAGLLPMMKTRAIALDAASATLWHSIADLRIRNGISRFARWASANHIPPANVSEAIIKQFVAELEAKTLVRNIGDQRRSVAAAWNALVALQPDLPAIELASRRPEAKRIPWERLPASLYADLEKYLTWCEVPDPLDDNARANRLQPATIRLRRDHVHSAVTAAVAAGVDHAALISLRDLVGVNTFKALLGKLYQADGNSLTAYTHGVAGTLITIASEWSGASTDELSALKKLRRKLGALPSGLTDKNKSVLRRFTDTRLLDALVQLPDKLWRTARRDLAAASKRAVIDLQTALAIDILLNVPLRMKNLASLSFTDHLHWPQGRGKPAMLIFESAETKNSSPLEFEIAAPLADRIWTYRTEIAPAIIGKQPEMLFMTTRGQPRKQETITNMIEKTVFKNLGLKLTPHQFRHLAAKIILDANPGAYEIVRQLLGHKNMKTTTNFYAGIDTVRAGRAHAELLMNLRDRGALPKQRRQPQSRHEG
jgi:integrase